MTVDPQEALRQQATQAATAAFQLYQRAYSEQFNALLQDERLFALEKQLIAQKYRNQGLELAALAVKAKQEAFHEMLTRIETKLLRQQQARNTQTP